MVLLAVVPGGPLGGLVDAVEHPVAELAAHRQHAAEEAVLLQVFELQQPGQPELVLDHPVLHPGLDRGPVHLHGLFRIQSRRLFSVDVLSRGNRLEHRFFSQIGALSIEVDPVVRIGQAGVQIRRGAFQAVGLGQGF